MNVPLCGQHFLLVFVEYLYQVVLRIFSHDIKYDVSVVPVADLVNVPLLAYDIVFLKNIPDFSDSVLRI